MWLGAVTLSTQKPTNLEAAQQIENKIYLYSWSSAQLDNAARMIKNNTTVFLRYKGFPHKMLLGFSFLSLTRSLIMIELNFLHI